MRLRLTPLLCLLLLCTLAARAINSPAAADSVQARRAALDSVLADHWEYTLSTSPETASILGDKRWNDQVTDYSQLAVDRDTLSTRQFLRRVSAIDTAGFPEQEALNRDLLVRDLETKLDGVRFKPWETPVSQVSGLHIDTAQLPGQLTFTTVKDYEDLIARYRKVPQQFDQVILQMRQGMADGLMPPKFLLGKVAAQANAVADMKIEDSPFTEPLARLPKEIPAAEQERLRTALTAAIREAVVPAYRKFATFVADEYAPKGRSEPGMWSMPDGDARYAYWVRALTTTRLTPDEIHRIGLQQVAELEAQMKEVAKRLGYTDLKTLNAALEKEPKVHARSREQILTLYRGYIDAMWAKLPELFGRLPKAKVEVLPVEPFREKEASSAAYFIGSPDGSRPGRVMVNTGDATSRKLLQVESTSYHEGVPGHHLQLTIAQELTSLPPFRQNASYIAFVEGWALYSERLGKEVGFYKDPYSDYGRLQDEMLRAIRLVVDTGMHAKRWTRDQVVQYFHDHSAIDEVEVQSETDRYMVWPGQALGYKIGQLKFLELRERAKKELGPRFDVRAFHDEVLGAGALPLDVLEARIDRWIAAQKAGKST